MLRPGRYTTEDIRKIQRACCHVFLSEEALRSVDICKNDRKIVSYPFLESLSFEDVKKAYRTHVMAYHPDRHQDKKPEEIAGLVRYLEGINRSFEYLCTFFGQRPSPPQEFMGRGKLIAIGGAKGGIGKSIFAANLGILLSSSGLRTVVVDLDLGGSDLHIYLGHKHIPAVTINDFLNRKVSGLSDVVIANDKGPMFIAGNNTELGAANIPFQKKMRLIDNIRKMNVDYVILDLGGGTDYNTLDFFLGADHGIVLTTLDQPSYVEAYAFIKTALHRKLSRLFAADSTFSAKKNVRLKEIISETIQPADEANPRTISCLFEKVAREDRLSFPLIADEVLSYSPSLVINRCSNELAAQRVAGSLRSVARHRLSIDISHIGSISCHPIIEQSTSYAHHPLVEKHQSRKFTTEMQSIINRLSLVNS
jgi:flagellar biosynthesis protein FlhG